MLKTLTFLLLAALGGQAQAQSCPEFFRLVDFGLTDSRGNTYRGGAVFRAETFGEEPLLLRERTHCIAVPQVSKDGRGNPIPVVTRIEYDPVKANIDLQLLRISTAEDTASRADRNARLHRATLDQPGTGTARGDSFLCAKADGSDRLSCQLASPFPGNTALVVYCDAKQCRMPVMAINDRLLVTAFWTGSTTFTDLETAGPEILDRVGQIHQFLYPISSGL